MTFPKFYQRAVLHLGALMKDDSLLRQLGIRLEAEGQSTWSPGFYFHVLLVGKISKPADNGDWFSTLTWIPQYDIVPPIFYGNSMVGQTFGIMAYAYPLMAFILQAQENSRPSSPRSSLWLQFDGTGLGRPTCWCRHAEEASCISAPLGAVSLPPSSRETKSSCFRPNNLFG